MCIKASDQIDRKQTKLMARLNEVQKKVESGKITPDEAQVWLQEIVEDSNTMYLAEFILRIRS